MQSAIIGGIPLRIHITMVGCVFVVVQLLVVLTVEGQMVTFGVFGELPTHNGGVMDFGAGRLSARTRWNKKLTESEELPETSLL